ncbi:condensation domain-containing protein [Aliikangiella coralliicola]|uniref:Condensation domain-containing protein n=1 Tax=Aliikangiella coralliicola TaxID=2592383 RepID=A0A545TV50_9GAMM|nr:condensation domain-containing protein [Aliikangiella coralliicola]TQV81092.1 hypothetical protein FLL46_26135 [Aliikangiella coralliicola]
MKDNIPLLSMPQVSLVKLMMDKACLPESLFPVFRIEKDNAEEGRGLSYAQQRLWFLHTSSNENSFYNEPILLELEGELNFNALKSALSQIQQRHEVLRTKFRTVDGVPVQIIQQVDEFPIDMIDLSDLPSATVNERVYQLYKEDASAEVDLSNDHLCKATLIKTGTNKHLLIFFMHHIVSDGWSMGVLLSELKILYENFLVGKKGRLEPLPIQYSDYALWEKQMLSGSYLDKLSSFWKKELQGAKQRISLPRDQNIVNAPTFKGDRIPIRLSKELSDNTVARSRELDERGTLFITLLSAFYIGLNYLGDDDDICVGTDIANRPNAESEQLIGFFVNQLVLRCKIDESCTFKQFATHVSDLSYRAFEHQAFPFDRVVDLMKHDRVSGISPIFQVKLVLQNAPIQDLKLPEVKMKLKPFSRGTSKFELLIDLTLRDSIIEGWLEYSLEYFEPSTAQRIVDVFENILSVAVACPEKSILQIKALVKQQERAVRRQKRKQRSSKTLKPGISYRSPRMKDAATE